MGRVDAKANLFLKKIVGLLESENSDGVTLYIQNQASSNANHEPLLKTAELLFLSLMKDVDKLEIIVNAFNQSGCQPLVDNLPLRFLKGVQLVQKWNGDQTKSEVIEISKQLFPENTDLLQDLNIILPDEETQMVGALGNVSLDGEV